MDAIFHIVILMRFGTVERKNARREYDVVLLDKVVLAYAYLRNRQRFMQSACH